MTLSEDLERDAARAGSDLIGTIVAVTERKRYVRGVHSPIVIVSTI